MSFVELMVHNILARKVRVGLTTVAVALGVMTVVTLGVVTSSLRTTAVAILSTGRADFTVAQKGVSDILFSYLEPAQVAKIESYPGVESAIGVLVAVRNLGPANPLFLEIGVPPDKLEAFGVQVVSGRTFAPTGTDEVMLGWRAAENLGKRVNDSLVVVDDTYRIVGIYNTGQVFGDSGSMFPLTTLQAAERKAGVATLVAVRARPGTDIDSLRAAIEQDSPELTTVRTESEFGRVDRNLVLISAADRGATIVALLIGAVIVMNTMLLSFFERTREFGVLRALGWARGRVVAMVMGEAMIISLLGAAVGVGLSFAATAVLERLPSLTGILHSTYSSGVFWRALYTAAGMAFLGALYPAARAALLAPLEAIRRE
jgi:putative ABC transport system permease protein